MMQQQNGLKIPMYLCLLLILAIPLLVTPDLVVLYTTGKNFAFRLLVELLFALYILLMLYDPRYQPRFSWILVSFLTLLFFSGLSALLGVDPKFSFLGSYARMDGIVTWVHLFMYFIVLSHFLKTQDAWSNFFYVSCLVAVLVVIRGVTDYTPTTRLSSTLGNVQFSAMYLFYQIFLVALLMVRPSHHRHRYVLGAMAVVIGIGLLSTGERGVFFALFCGVMSSVIYACRSRLLLNLKYLTIATLLLGFLIILLMIYPPDVLKHYPVIARYFDLHFLKESFLVREKLWLIGLKGFIDHPILGWGMNNFTYVFNQYYDSFYCRHEMWFDQSHNAYLEWLVTGGIFGLLSFLALLISPVICCCSMNKPIFTDRERMVLIGLMVGYGVIHLFYFDTIASTLCFINLLAFIHAKVSNPMTKWIFSRKFISFAVMPQLMLSTILIFYLTLPSILAARDAMFSSHLTDLKAQYLWMHQAWVRQEVGNLEIIDRFSHIVNALLQSDTLSIEEKYYLAEETEAELKDFIHHKPRDPRGYYALSVLYSLEGQFDNAKETIHIARSLTPRKEFTMMLEGSIAFRMGDLKEAGRLFKKSICLKESQLLYYRVNHQLLDQSCFYHEGGQCEIMEKQSLPIRRSYTSLTDVPRLGSWIQESRLVAGSLDPATKPRDVGLGLLGNNWIGRKQSTGPKLLKNGSIVSLDPRIDVCSLHSQVSRNHFLCQVEYL